jgi:hypothetical protein
VHQRLRGAEPRHLDDATRAEHHDDVRVHRGDRGEQLGLRGVQRQRGAVQALGLGDLVQAEEQQDHLGVECRGDGLGPQCRVGRPVPPEAGGESRHLQAAVPDHVEHRVQPGRVHGGRAGALVPRSPGEVADDGHAGSGAQRQESVVVLQQHRRSRGDPAGQRVVGVGVDGRGGAGLPGVADQVEDLGGAGVQVGLREPPVADGGRELARRVEARGRHLERAAGRGRRDDVVGTAPVRDDRAVEAPLVSQHLLQQEGVLVRVGAVDPVVGRHDRAGPGRLDHDAERGQVDLPQGALIDHGVRRHPAQLLRVGGVVLGAGGDAGRLDAAHVARCHPPREQRVLGEVLEVPPAERRALDVQARAEQHVDVLRGGLGPERAPDLLGQLGVPGVRDRRRSREAGGGLRVGDAEVVRSAGLLAHAVRAVGQPQGPDTVPGQVVGLPDGLARQQGGLLEQGEVLDHRVRRPRWCGWWVTAAAGSTGRAGRGRAGGLSGSGPRWSPRW